MSFSEKKLLDISCDFRYQVRYGQSSSLQDFFVNHKDLIKTLIDKQVLHEAARHNNVTVVKMFLDAGYSPDSCPKDYPKWTTLDAAIEGSAIDVINLLLDVGSDIHRTKIGNSASYLTAAVLENNLSLVKFFFEHGVDINAEYMLNGTRMNALKWAMIKGYYDIAEYLRSKGAVWIEDSTGEPQTPEESMLQFLSEQFKSKPLPLGLSEIIPASLPLSVHIFPPAKRKKKTTIFVTSGLSDYSLIVPQGKLKYKFAEYILEMPGEWEVTDKALEEKHNYLPIKWIKAIGRYPHENQTYYDNETKITAQQIPSLKTQDGNDNIADIKYDPNLDFIIPQDGRTIVFYRISLPNNALVHKL
jgi:ankyrin repeat protein